eukprot:m.98063 g.98063  ORF g.98063 m.98063 type:complete len:156 (+) comp12417_c0_seq2:377-844(+)
MTELNGRDIVPLSAQYPQVPRIGWFVVSGGLGDVLMFALSRLIAGIVGSAATSLHLDADTAVWLVCFSASISWRHVLHAHLVFGGQRASLVADMVGTYKGYILGILFSTALRWMVAKTEILTGNIAFFAVLYTTALFNFAVLSRINKAGTVSKQD